MPILRYPAVAFNNYQEFISNPYFNRIYSTTIEKLETIKSFAKRTEFIHQHIDESLKNLLKNENVTSCVQCKKGCNHCCYTEIGITKDEALYYSNLIKKNHVSIDFELLNRQQNFTSSWYELQHQDRKCVFLNTSNECSIYEIRPSVCRTNIAITSPDLCDTKNGNVKLQRLLKTTEADFVMMAHYIFCQDNNLLPKQIFKEHSKRIIQHENHMGPL